MTTKSEITLIAEAILANCRILEMLVQKLPDAVKEQVAEKVAAVNPTPIPVVTATVATVTPTAPIPVAPTVPVPTVPVPTVTTPTPMPPVAAPTVGVSVPTAALAPVANDKAPFTDQRGMIAWVMGQYKELGMEKGKQIQDVLNALGTANINEVKPEHFDALYVGVMALHKV